MLVYKKIALIFFSCWTLFFTAQENRLYIDFDDPISSGIINNPHELEKYASIYLKNTKNFDNLNAVLKQIEQLKNIHSLIIGDYEDKKIPEVLANCKTINKITLLNCKELNIKQIIKYLGKLPTLETINLGNCQIETIPSEIKHCNQLRSINISMNNMLDLPSSIEALSQCKHLEAVSLPVNQISELPQNISLLSNIKELNLSNNNLTDLPEEIGELDSLQSISMQKNIIVSPLKTYEKLNPLNINFLSIDEITDEELEILQSRFPNAEILQSKKPSLDLYELHQQFKDSIAREVSQKNTPQEENPFVIEKRESIEIKVMSLAYLHYAESFDPITNADFKGDTLTFDERYLDTNYFNIYRRQNGLPFDYFELTMVKPDNKNTLWFDFKLTEYFYYNFPEYFAFNNMSWVVVNPKLDKRTFKQQLIKNKKYTDFRLAYNDIEKNFNLQLKTANGFVAMTVIPKLKTRKKSTAEEQSSYEMRYIKYLESLNSRRLDFDKELKEKKSKYLLELRKIRTKAWTKFSELYLSEEERSWPQEEWLTYYDQVIANQDQALLNAQMDFKYLEQYLVLKQFEDLNSIERAEDIYGTAKKVQFSDVDLKPVSITSLYLIDNSTRTFKQYKGSNAPMEFYLFSPDRSIAIIARLRNGNYAIAKSDVSKGNLISLEEYPAEWTQLYDLMNKLKLL